MFHFNGDDSGSATATVFQVPQVFWVLVYQKNFQMYQKSNKIITTINTLSNT